MKFADLLTELGVAVKHAGSGGHTREGWVNFACPFCGGGKHADSMGYNLHKGYLHCYKCGHHRIIDTVMVLADLPYKKAKALVGDVEQGREPEIIVKRGKLELPAGVRDMNDAHKKYLIGRGFDPEEIAARWGVKGIGIGIDLSHRLFIPIHYRGEVVSWTTRSIKPNATMRYRSAEAHQEAINHKELLYGEDFCQHAICVVEGPPDVWRIGPGAVATFGTEFTSAQLLRMSKYPVIGICFDNEALAQRRAQVLAKGVQALGGMVQLIKLDAKDAGEAEITEIAELKQILSL